MERESFESEEVAAIMNEKFVNIKVDREERPDVDKVYVRATSPWRQTQSIAPVIGVNGRSWGFMRANWTCVQMTYILATSGGGGWPMSVFLTPGLEPILGGALTLSQPGICCCTSKLT